MFPLNGILFNMKRIAYIFVAILSLVSCGKTDPEEIKEDIPKQGFVPDPIDPGRFTILSWTGVNNSYADYGFRKLLEAGFNTYLGWYDNISDAEYALSKADEIGIKMIISCPELHTDTKNVTAAFCKHPSFLAYHIEDEPEVSEFGGLAGQINNIEQYDKTHASYVNLYPNWCWGEDAYLTKIRLFAKDVPVKFISFDNYPCKTVGGVTTVRSDWYHNLEDIRTVAKENKIPMWAFALSLSHKTNEASYPIPTIGELRLQMFSNLVYGATGFQYFTTWGHIQNDHCTSVYQDVKKVNEELIGLEPIFLGADIKYIWHMGNKIPSGCKKFSKTPDGIATLSTDDGNAVVSYLVNNGKKYIAIVNTNPNGGMNLDISFVDNSKAVKYDKACNGTSFTPGVIRVAAGDLALYSWE